MSQPGSPFVVSVTPVASRDLCDLLTRHLPFSLPLLRRLQFALVDKKPSPRARVISITDENERFIVAWADVSGGPDTQMWLYSTLEDGSNKDIPEAVAVCEQQLRVLVEELIKLGKEYGRPLSYAKGLLLGSLHSEVRNVFERTGRVERRATGDYFKWLFRDATMPSQDFQLPEGMHWSTATEDDCRVVISRTDIPRTVETLARMPSQVIKLTDGTPIAWAFLTPDGALGSLHCEEPYRRRGLAKALASKLFRERTKEFASDGWSHADVSGSNQGSQAMCRSLNGTPHWVVSWVLLDISEDAGGKST